MGRPLQTAWRFEPGPLTVPAVTETVLVTTPSVTTPLEVNHIHLQFSMVFTSNGANDFYTFKVYRGSSTSAPLAHTVPQLAPSYTTSENTSLVFDFAEDVSNMDNVQYTVSLTTNGGTSTCQAIFARADVS